MSILVDWKNHIKQEEYEKIIDFIEQTKNGVKIINKFLFVVGNIQKALKLIIDIENEICIDECDYIEYSNLEDIFVDDKDEYILCSNYSNTKCLTIELNNKDHNINKVNNFGIVKEIISQTNLNFNLIIISENLFVDCSMLKRAIIVNFI